MPEATPPTWAMTGDFFSVTRSKEELSIVTRIENLPSWELAESLWRAFKVHGPFAFTEIGVLASLAAPLAKDGVGIFVVSTFYTDYLLVQLGQIQTAIASLRATGHTILDTHFLTEMKENAE
jgi:hypothetical protein